MGPTKGETRRGWISGNLRGAEDFWKNWRELSIIRYIGTTDCEREYDGVEYQKLGHWYQMSYKLGTAGPLVPDSGEGISECCWFLMEEISDITIREHLWDFIFKLCEYSDEMLDLGLS